MTPDPYVWAPAAYLPLTKALLDRLELKSEAGSRAGGTAESLLEPTSAAMAEENDRISEQLTRNMMDGGTHARAALLLATLALREAAGQFADARPALCRVTAHLAMARALGGGGDEGDLAEAGLLAMARRQHEALAKLDAIERRASASSATRAWLRALRLRVTGDWRLLRDPSRASLLEKVELFRAASRTLGGSPALALADRMGPMTLPDWSRVALTLPVEVEQIPITWGGKEWRNLFAPEALTLELGDLMPTWQVDHGPAPPGYRLSALRGPLAESEAVEVVDWPLWSGFFEWGGGEWRSVFASQALTLELADLQQTWQVGHGPAAPGNRLSDFLGWHSASARPEVLDWPLWSGFFERHLCHAAQQVEYHLRTQDLPQDAAAMRKATMQALDGLPLRPLLSLVWAPRPHPGAPVGPDDPACQESADLLRRHPELATASIWETLRRQCYQQRSGGALPHMTLWFSPPIPRGTAYDFEHRVRDLPWPERVKVRGLAPFDALAIRGAAVIEGVGTPAEVADYDLGAMFRAARGLEGRPAQYRKHMERVAAVSPKAYLTLANYLFDRGLDDAAAAVLEKALAKVPALVEQNPRVGSLVDYYYDRHRDDDALRTAQLAADTNALDGLATMGRLMERMGKYKDAEQWYRKAAERDPRSTYLDEFYARHRQRVGGYEKEAAVALVKLFPQGLRQVSLVDLAGHPTPDHSNRFAGDEELRVDPRFRYWMGPGGRRLQMETGTVVAVDGYRVTNWAQFNCVRSFSDDPYTRLILRHQGGYRELKEQLPRGKYGPPRRPS